MQGDQGHIFQLLGSTSDLLMPFDDPEQNLDIHLCAQRQYSCLGDPNISPQAFNMRFMSSYSTSDHQAHDPHISTSTVTAQPIRYPESSQRTTSAFPSFAQYDNLNRNFSYVSACATPSAPVLPCNSSSGDSGWISGQDAEQESLARLDMQPLNCPDSQCRVQVSPDSPSTEYILTDDSDIETGIIMSKMMVHFQVHTPPLDADMSTRVPGQQLPTPSMMTFRLGRRTLRPVMDPDSAKILENFDDIDEDTSEDSWESLSSSSPLYSPTSFYDERAGGSLRDDVERAVTEVASPTKRRGSYTPDRIPSLYRSGGNMHPRRAPRKGRTRTNGSSRKSKMHECKTCHKIFPRPSGLKTHMNSHSGAKPFECPVSSCDKRFAVRSNAKRHLKTHGINPSLIEGPSQGSNFTVGFEVPLVNYHVHDAGRPPARLRWIPHSLATRTHPVGDCDWAGTSSLAGDESESYPILSALLPACSSSNPASVYHYGNATAGSRHYHSNQVYDREDSGD